MYIQSSPSVRLCAFSVILSLAATSALLQNWWMHNDLGSMRKYQQHYKALKKEVLAFFLPEKSVFSFCSIYRPYTQEH